MFSLSPPSPLSCSLFLPPHPHHRLGTQPRGTQAGLWCGVANNMKRFMHYTLPWLVFKSSLRKLELGFLYFASHFKFLKPEHPCLLAMAGETSLRLSLCLLRPSRSVFEPRQVLLSLLRPVTLFHLLPRCATLGDLLCPHFQPQTPVGSASPCLLQIGRAHV